MRWSIIVCTHNRAEDLRVTLAKISLLDYPAEHYEIVVIDNCSTDETQAVAESAKNSISNVVYAREDKLGISHARNKGIEVAQGQFIAYIDDDAWPDRDWLKKIEECFSDAKVVCVGGRVIPFWQKLTGWPSWLHERLAGFFTEVNYSNYRKLNYPDYPVTTNVAFRKSIFMEIGTFNTELGRIGGSLLSCEDTELCLRIEQAGYDISYTPDAVVHHKVHESRLTKEWVKQRSYWQGISAAVVERARFNRSKIVIKTLKYLFFIQAGLLGEIFFKYVKNEKLSFFCMCQVILCKAYIMKVWKSI